MKLGVGLLAVSMTLLAFSCGKSGSSESNDGGASGTSRGGTSPAGNGPMGGKGQASGAGGATAGSSAQSGAGGGGNASGSGGTGAQAGTATSSAGAGGTTDPEGGQAGSGDTTGAGGEGNPAGSLTLFVMFDRSWSMNQCGDGTETPVVNNGLDCPTLSRWDLTSAALIQFFQDPAALDLNVALRFFPDDVPGCTGYPSGFPGLDAGTEEDAGSSGPNCDVDVCSEPLVAAAPLSAEPAPVDVHEAALVAAVMASTPPGPENPNPNPQTPTSPALAGAEKWAVAYRKQHPDEPTAVVLITDGEPTGCDTSPANIAQLAADAHEEAGVLTYVVGLSGSSEQGLDQIAVAGGTEGAFFVSDGSTTVQDLFAALSAIRGATH